MATRTSLLLALALATTARAQAPTVTTSALRFAQAPWAMVQNAPDSVATAWCAGSWKFDGDTVYVSNMNQTSQAFDPPCGNYMIIIKRPNCFLHYMELVHWLLEPPRALVAICHDSKGEPHFISIDWGQAPKKGLSISDDVNRQAGFTLDRGVPRGYY